GFVYDKKLVGPYRLVAVDIDEQMMLCWSLPGGDCVGDNLPGPMIFAAGFDDRYVVVAQHPWSQGSTEPPNIKVTRFYYVVRDHKAEVGKFGPPPENIKGPFDQNGFEAEKVRLKLPDFSWRYGKD